mgnify:CR=1 FL=1|tara:strand:+ start:1414 stop:1752 length:339 start_codon:yes stop_codon:yes gene_type:complete
MKDLTIMQQIIAEKSRVYNECKANNYAPIVQACGWEIRYWELDKNGNQDYPEVLYYGDEGERITMKLINSELAKSDHASIWIEGRYDYYDSVADIAEGEYEVGEYWTVQLRG